MAIELLNFASYLCKHRFVALVPRDHAIWLLTPGRCISWLMGGCVFLLLLRVPRQALLSLALPFCIGMCAFMWDSGWVSFMPSVERKFVRGQLPWHVLCPLTWLQLLPSFSRLISVAAEVLCATIGYGCGFVNRRTLAMS